MADFTITTEDSAGNPKGTPSSVDSNNAKTVIADSVATIKDSDDNTLYTKNILAEATDETIIANSVSTIKDTDDNTLFTNSILAEGTNEQIIPDSTIFINTIQVDTVLSTGSFSMVIQDSEGTQLEGTYDSNTGIFTLTPTVIEIPTNLQFTEGTDEATGTWTASTSTGVTNYKIYRQVVLSPIDDARQLVHTTADGSILTWTDTNIEAGLEHLYDVQTVTASGETDTLTPNVNYISITMSAPTVTQPAVLLTDGDYLDYVNALAFNGEFDIKIGIQGLSDPSGDVGLMGSTSGSADRVLLGVSLNRVRGNYGTNSLKTLSNCNPVLELDSKKILRFYKDSSDDIYFQDGDSTPQFIANVPLTTTNFDLDAIGKASTFGTAGYIWYVDDGVDIYNFKDAYDSDPTTTFITGSNGGQLDLNGGTWVADLPTPSNSTWVENLGVNANNIDNIYDRLATINASNHSHILVSSWANDVANPTKYNNPTDYETVLGLVVDSLQLNGSTVVLGSMGCLGTDYLKATKDFSADIDILMGNTTWDFNLDVLPLYNTSIQNVATAKGCDFVDVFNDIFVPAGVTDLSLITGGGTGADGVHWVAGTYVTVGVYFANHFKTLPNVTSIGCVGNSIMNIDLANQINISYNS